MHVCALRTEHQRWQHCAGRAWNANQTKGARADDSGLVCQIVEQCAHLEREIWRHEETQSHVLVRVFVLCVVYHIGKAGLFCRFNFRHSTPAAQTIRVC